MNTVLTIIFFIVYIFGGIIFVKHNKDVQANDSDEIIDIVAKGILIAFWPLSFALGILLKD